jgi:hypothetical protein
MIMTKERELNKLPVFESRAACLTRREKVGILEYSCLFVMYSDRVNRLSKW